MGTRKAPVLFVGHGSPMNAIGDNRSRKEWKRMGEALGKPRVIIAVSAHWLTHGLHVRRSATNPQINDMYGFPEALYAVKYSPAGDIETAEKVMSALGEKAVEDNAWGIDHGVWAVLCNMYPEGDVPVVMVSVDDTASAAEQYNVGKRLASLRNEGAMIVASGNVVHNLRLVNWRMREGYPWADDFDNAIQKAITEKRFDDVINYESIADHAMAVPTTEHFFPLLTAIGATTTTDSVTVWNEYRELGSMSMTSYLWQET